jgi:hypothetical protein
VPFVAVAPPTALGSPRLVALPVVTLVTSPRLPPGLPVTTASTLLSAVSALVVAPTAASSLVMTASPAVSPPLLLADVRLFRMVVLVSGDRPRLPVLVEALALSVVRVVPVRVAVLGTLLAQRVVADAVLVRVGLLRHVAVPQALLLVLAPLLPFAGGLLSLLAVGRAEAAHRVVVDRVGSLEFGLPVVPSALVALVRVLLVGVALPPSLVAVLPAFLVAVLPSSALVPSPVSVFPGHGLVRSSTAERVVACACDCNRLSFRDPG